MNNQNNVLCAAMEKIVIECEKILGLSETIRCANLSSETPYKMNDALWLLVDQMEQLTNEVQTVQKTINNCDKEQTQSQKIDIKDPESYKGDFINNIANEYYYISTGCEGENQIEIDIPEEIKEKMNKLDKVLNNIESKIGSEKQSELYTLVMEYTLESEKDSFKKGFKYALKLAGMI
ncbi:hypothetical protein [Butyrivibrio sp. YAB3001]|uniref:hypothetical protein n=1 Tax=Butyrivibrio sp. YAB3001 TaxID=1520812 RepID=UPI0008F63343|nr:hypothetical protein [Butyrivibrio sp. YAB3001]SFB86734.1 hypothetical protein SAMN02910398_00929 [Butyrivibrio sp. YAB3001]